MAPQPDLGAVFDEHMRCEFVLKDAERTMATMTDNPVLNHVPMGTGGSGRDAVLAFSRDIFIPSRPDDARTERIARTVGTKSVVDEIVVSFTHTRPMEFMIPGVAPTGRAVALPHVLSVGFEGDKIAYERVYWDQASLLAQVGLLDPSTVPVLGTDQATKVLAGP